MSASGLPFDDIRTLCRMLPPPDGEAMATARARNAALAKPAGSLGRLETIAEWVAGWQGNALPQVMRPLAALFAASHGVAAHLPPPQIDAAERLAQAAAGGAAINQVCATHDIGLKVFELALQHPTHDITVAAALEERDCTATIAFGMEAIAGGADLLCLGEIASGSYIAVAAMLSALLGGEPAQWLEEADPALKAHQADLAGRALTRNAGQLGDPLEVLRRLGGREIAAATGAILAARIQRIPVVLDSLAVAAAGAVLYSLDPGALDHCLAGHSAGPVHARALARLGLTPVLDLDVTLGEGVGAAMAAGIIRAALACHAGMAKAEAPPRPPVLN